MEKQGITINQYSLSSFYCESYFNNTQLSSATCFLIRRDKQLYLVTNWHVVTGRNPDTGECLSCTGAVPNNLHIYFPMEIEDCVEYSSYQVISLADSEGNPMWIEKQIGSRFIDVIVLPIALESKFKAFCIEDAEEPYNENPLVEITSSLYVLGFPFGRKWGVLPIWKKASIASEPEYETDEGFSYFFVDSASRSGMSGSPVVLFERRPMTMVNETEKKFSRHFTKFIGIYSGRIGVNDVGDVQLGRVWKAWIIDELIGGEDRTK